MTVSPTSATLSAATTGTAPTTTLSLSTVEGPQGRLTIIPGSGSKGYASASFNGTSLVVTGEAPGTMAAGTYQDTLSVKVCYDAQCAQPVADSPLSIPVTYTVTQGDPAVATPTITGLSPTSVTAGSAAFTLTVSGSNFTPTSTVLWNGQARATTYVAAATLSAQITAADVASLSTASVTVSNSSTGGGVSAAQSFSVAAVVPAITSLSPATAVTGGSTYTLTVNGTGFDSSAQVSWNGSPLVTTFVSATQVTAAVPSADIAATGSFPVTVWNSDGSANASGPVSVAVAPAPLTLALLAPPQVSVGGPTYIEILLGSGFTASSTAQLNGSARSTTFVSATELRMQVTAADIASIGTATVTVANGGATPATSGPQTLTIAASTAAIDATAFQVNAQHNGAAHFANIAASGSLPTAPAWTATLDGTPSYPLVAGGRVFLTVARSSGGGSELVALNAGSGDIAWGPIAISGAAAATYDNGRVMVLNSSGVLTGYDAASGTQLWTTTLTGQTSFTAPPTAYNGIVYTGGSGSGGTLYAYDDATGLLKWTKSVQNGDDSSPSVSASGVYVSYPCQTYDFDPASGAPLWNNDTGCEGGGGATGAWANGVYYSPNGPAGFSGMSFNAASGAVVSSYMASQPPAFGATNAYTLTSLTLTASSLADNSTQWSFTGDGTLMSAPILVNNYVFIASDTGRLYMLDAATGAQLSVVSLGGIPDVGVYSSVSVWGMNAGDGLLLVPFGSKLSAFTLSSNP